MKLFDRQGRSWVDGDDINFGGLREQVGEVVTDGDFENIFILIQRVRPLKEYIGHNHGGLLVIIEDF